MYICCDENMTTFVSLFTFIIICVIIVNAAADNVEDTNKEIDKDLLLSDDDYLHDDYYKSIETHYKYHGVKGKTQDNTNIYHGNCNDRPKIPINGKLKCYLKSCKARCNADYQFPNGENQLIITCKKGAWKIIGTEWQSVPHCEPICLPQCQNNGICIAPNECKCPDNFSGPRCQFEKKPCLNDPPPVQNSRRSCDSKICTIACINKFIFPDGSSVANLMCRDGNWVPARSDWVSIPDCRPTCTPTCQNGGVCLALNVCQCPQDFRGPQCQYSVDVCSTKNLGFNGGYKCKGDENTFSCKLHCPTGVEFTSPPVSEYICAYENGVFEPQPIPQCKITANYQIVPIESVKNTFYKVTNHSWTIEGSSISKMHFNELQNGVMKYRKDASTIKNTRVKGGKFMDFSEEIQSKSCIIWGGTYYNVKTFDGEIYTFESSCAYTLVQETQMGIFTITVENSRECQSSENADNCYRILKIFLEGKEYILQQNNLGSPELRTLDEILPIPIQLSGIRVEMSTKYTVVSLDWIGASIQWDGGVYVEIKTSKSLWDRVAGLCRRLNGNWTDDRTTRDFNYPRNVADFVSAWKVLNIGETCDENPIIKYTCDTEQDLSDAQNFCNDLFHHSTLEIYCNVNHDFLLDTCQWDYCACKNNDKRMCPCKSRHIYSHSCAFDHGLKYSDWRRDDLCPINCTGGKIYRPCGSLKQSTCSTQFPDVSSDKCEAGCFCPENTVLHQEKCISVEKCPCTLRGKIFSPGTSIRKDCNTCTCSTGKWVCTEVSCGARCAAVGDPHYITFDKKHYDFMGKCNYYLVKGDNYSIETENVACSGAISESMGLSRSSLSEQPSCTKSTTIRLGDVSIKLKQNHQILVNGEDITKLPFLISGAKIRIASSIFIVVNLPNGLEIWWDGISRIYVNAPADFRGRTKGLCGTFTANQKDDFLTPFGDIEQSVIPFANKWKTSELCNDLPLKESTHPCNTNPEKRITAEKHCSKILKSIFSECHWYVDPEQFYEDCKYDMCACESDLERCLCPTFAAYAKECAAADMKILWRNEFEECRIHCPTGQEYQICGNSCTRSCADISFYQDCRQECIEGCNCPEGQTLDDKGECISIGQCPCQYNGREFNAGYREIRPGRKSRELCTCGGGVWTCHSASPEEIKEYPAMVNLTTLCSASKYLEATNCEPAEPKTCRNMHEPINQSPAVCRPGCVCKKEYVLDTPSGVCVEEKKCPCYHGGKSYKEGVTMQEDCNTCQCHGGKWKCSDRICPGICSAWGDSHYTTFDGKTYDFQGLCDYVLVKASFTNDESFYVSIQNVPCGSAGVACSKSVTLNMRSGEIQESITLIRGKALPSESTKEISIRKAGLFIFLDVSELGLVLQWDQGTRVYVKLDPKWKGRTTGLCGDYNDNSADDFKTPSGGIAEASARLFGDSWKKDSYCPEPKDITDTCAVHPERKLWAIENCGILKGSLFQQCHSEVDIEPYIQRCIFDTCGCDGGGDCECLCTVLAAYAHACNSRGVSVKWRSQELCPIQCDESCSTYSSCISTCPQETCDNLLSLSRSHLCTQDTCVEGCLLQSCPDGQVYKNSTSRECVSRSTCKPYCTEINGIIYYEGDKVSSDACQTCFCSRKKIVCNGAPCTTTTIKPTTILMEESEKCVDGWTNWLNKRIPKSAVKGGGQGKMFSDIEPLPTMLDLLNMKNSSHCQKENMIDIECRTVIGHKKPKETNVDVECDLEHGLYCQSHDPKLPCEDFEIRVLCQCNQPEITVISTSTSTTRTTMQPVPVTEFENCDVNHPNQQHPTDCYTFYQCVSTFTGTKLVEKSCSAGTMYNPETQICDWPYNVFLVRPECGKIVETTKEPNQCKEGEEWDDCAIQCNQTCQHYYHILEEQNLCTSHFDCVPGCIADACPSYKFWRDSRTCVEISDCPCVTHNKTIVKPGVVITESECERCQCLSNYYTCDKSLCTTTKLTTPSLPLTTTGRTTENNIIIVTSTVSPAEPCISDHYKSLIKYFKSEILFNASSLAEPEYQAESAKLTDADTDNILSDNSGWQPKFTNSEQWLDIKFPRLTPIYGIIVRGNPVENKYVTSYKVLFSQDEHIFSYIINSENNKPKIFQGPIDSLVPTKQFFPEPIEAKIIRINPNTWHHGIAMKVDLLGCDSYLTTIKEISLTTSSSVSTVTTVMDVAPELFTTIRPQIHEEKPKLPVCDEPMGLDNEIMLEEQITASSALGNLIPNLQLSSSGIWRPILDNPNQYVQFDFLQNRNLTGIQTKGFDGIWTTAYKLFYGDDIRYWNPIMDDEGREKIFLGNFDDKSSKINYFDTAINARYLKIQPIKWHNHIGLKAEIHGCFVPYPEKEVRPVKIIELKLKCNVCHLIFQKSLEHSECNCNDSLWWNGESCVEKQQCPCVVDHIPYSVGTTFETNDCQKCLCGMGGTPDCHFKKCSPCDDPNMQSIVTELCGCACKPCPVDSVLCPTTNICIKKSSWCNGVKDCPDDETNCVIEEPKSTKNVTTNTKSVIVVTTVETKNVTKFQCEKPECPSGYKLIPVKQFPLKHSHYTSFAKKGYVGIKGGVKGGVKGGGVKGERQRIAKEPRRTTIQHETSSTHDVECQQFSCKPTKPPPLIEPGVKQQCPTIKCPPDYRVVFEPISMYNPTPCPKYICKPPPPIEVTCNVTGKTFNTFDNLEYKYDICNHILAREMYQNQWYITLEKHCSENKRQCSKVLAIVIDNDVIVLHPDMHVDINEFTFTARQIDYLQNQNPDFKICRIGNFIHFTSLRHGFWIIWDQNSNVKIGITTMLAHHVDGLCGYFDGIAENDRQMPDGSRALTSEEFGNSWVMDGTPECQEQNCPRDVLDFAREICDTLRDGSFAICRNVMDIEKSISRCLESTCMCMTGNGTKNDCRCRALSSFSTECQSADFNIDLSTWRNIHNCPIHCTKPFVYKDCFRNKCEATCENLQEIEPCPLMDVCFSGCFCPDKTVRNGDACISASECRDCTCSSYGNANYVNFDKKNFTFTGNCTYILSRDITKNIDGKIGENTYQILMTNVPCDKGVCTEALTVLYKGHFLQIEQIKSINGFIGTIDGEPLEIPLNNNWMSIEKVGNHDVTLLIPAIQLEVISYWHNYGFMIRLPSHIFGGAVEGLCGSCNLNEDDGFTAASGLKTKDVDEFGLSWLATAMPESRYSTSEICTSQPAKKCPPPPAENPCSVLLNESIFGQCHNLVDPSTVVESCHDTLCEKGDICGDLETYARRCRQVGICPIWRSHDFCPFICPNHLEYYACGTCQQTCNSLNEVHNNVINEKKCNDNIEGCFCPKDHVLHNETCIPERNCFICDDQGHIDGDFWNVDKCTSCSCSKKIVSCQTKECPAVETICEDDFIPVVVPGSENECCLKYLCIPVPTVAPTCVEPQQPECGYGQVMKLTTGPDGCQKFICQCLPPDECPIIAEPLSPEVEKEQIGLGYIQVVNTTGCCPRSVVVCKPEICPPPPTCPTYYEIKVSYAPEACCPSHDCEPPKNLCLYTFINNNDSNNGNVTATKIGDTWKDGPCNICTCEKALTDSSHPKSACKVTECPSVKNNPDIYDYVLEKKTISGQCCPQIERSACKDNDKIYRIEEEWYPDVNDACVIIKCENSTMGVIKKTFNQECNILCDVGYEYKPATNKKLHCCGECVPIACVVNDTLKNINEKWYSNDFCTNYECLLDNKNIHIKESHTQCVERNYQEDNDYVIKSIQIPGNCCLKYIRTACKSNGTIYKSGMSWKDELDTCLTETCVQINSEKVEIQKTVQACNTSCEFGWEYLAPEEGQCCGRCKPAFCVYESVLYNPGSVWYSEDNCTTYKCQYYEDQPMVSTSAPVCPDVAKCPLEDIYSDGCCDACNMTTLDLRKTCMAEVLELDTTIGIISEIIRGHGVCRNLQGIDGLTECHGSCPSSTRFNHITWYQETDCKCCQPSEMKKIHVNLTCSDGKTFLKTIYVPTACSCHACESPRRKKSKPSGVKV